MRNSFKMLTGLFFHRKCIQFKMAAMNESDWACAVALTFDLKVTEMHIMCLKIVSEDEEFN
jgi:hypothetical protein